jgi:hypothetical protein
MDKLFQIESIQGDDFIGLDVAQLTGVKKVLGEFAKKVVEDAQKNLDKGGRFGQYNATFNLRQSIDPSQVREEGNGYTVEITMADYWKYVNEGVLGKKSGLKAQGSPFQYGKNAPIPTRAGIEKWMQFKSIVPEDGGSRQGLAYVIRRSIINTGTPRTLFFDKALPESLMKALTEDVAEAFGKSISISIKI